jgi:hypothetical protein
MAQEELDKENQTTFTPWHKVFQYILEELLPEDAFDIIPEYEVGKLPLKVDFIVIKRLKKVTSGLPYFFSFLNDYKYAVIEYKAPAAYFTFNHFLKLLAYGHLFKISKTKLKLDKIIRLGVFNATSRDFYNEMEQYGYKAEQIEKGLYCIDHKSERSYLINLEQLSKSNKELLLSFLSKYSDKYKEAFKRMESDSCLSKFAEYLDNLINRSEYMRLIKQDKEWAKRANWTLEQFVQNLKPELRLKGLKPEERLIGLKPEEIQNIEKYIEKLKNKTS